MIVTYSNDKVRKQCTNFKEAKRKFPQKVPLNLFKLINLLEAADSLADIQKIPKYNLHALRGNYAGKWALRVDGNSGYRLIVSFELDNATISIHAVDVTEINIEEVSKHYE